jgi:hypothetical protein
LRVRFTLDTVTLAAAARVRRQGVLSLLDSFEPVAL